MSTPQYITIERYGANKYDVILVRSGRVVERTDFRSWREAYRFATSMEESLANVPYLPAAAGGQDATTGLYDMPPTPVGVGWGGEIRWSDDDLPFDYHEPLDLTGINPDDIPF